jgi:hypothetical protein
MQKVHRYISGALLTAGLAVPAALVAGPVPQDARVQVRVYDSEQKDYHNWDDHENAAWGRFLEENRRKHHEFAKGTRKSRRNTGTGATAIQIKSSKVTAGKKCRFEG